DQDQSSVAVRQGGGVFVAFTSNAGATGNDLFGRAVLGPTTTGGTATLASVNQGEPNPPGATGSSLFGSLTFTDLGGSTLALGGVALTANAAITATQGKWQSSPDGTTWTDIATTISNTSAVVLASGDKIRFLPVAAFTGTPGNLTARLWDGLGTTGVG